MYNKHAGKNYQIHNPQLSKKLFALHYNLLIYLTGHLRLDHLEFRPLQIELDHLKFIHN